MKTIEAQADRNNSDTLLFPTLGYWKASAKEGFLVGPGSVLGVIEVLGVERAVVCPAGAVGSVVQIAGSGAVQYGDSLVVLTPVGDLAAASSIAEAGAASGKVFRAPTSGRFYARPSPEAAAFAEVGSTVSPGQVVCLIEVMKTFSRVTLDGEGISGSVKIAKVLCKDGDDIEAGQPLFEFE